MAALVMAILDLVADPDWTTRARDGAHWLLLFATPSFAIAIYIHITRFELEVAKAAPITASRGEVARHTPMFCQVSCSTKGLRSFV